MKKILTVVFASALALTLAAPIASACPGHKEKATAKEKEAAGGEVAQKGKAGKAAEPSKDTKKGSDTKQAEKKPVKVSQK